MKPLLLLPLLLLGLFSPLVWAEDGEAEAVAAEKKACEAAIKEDDARDEQKLTDAYRAKCKALAVASVPLKPLETGGSGSTAARTQTDEAAPTTATGGGGATEQAAAPPAAREGGETRLGAFAPDESYPDEGARGRGGAENAMAFRQGYLDEGKRDLKDTQIDNEHYLAGASAQRNEARVTQAQADANYPDETQKGMGATGSGAAYREGYLANKDGNLNETRAEADANYRAGSEGHKQDVQTAIANNTNPVITDSGEVVKDGKDQLDTPKADPAALTTRSTLPEPQGRTAEEKQNDARATASRTATEQLQKGLIASTAQGRSMQILQHCRELGYNEQVCASSLRVAQKESKFNPYAQNGSSSARGTYQYINSTWDSECTRNMSQSVSWCRANRDNMAVQNEVMFKTVDQRFQRYNNGSLNCQGIQGFDACNYIVYHHTFAAGDPVGYYNRSIGSADAAYRVAFNNLAGNSPDVALAQLSLTQGTTVTAGNNAIINRSLGYYGNQGTMPSYSNVASIGGYQDYGYTYSNPVNYNGYQYPSYAPSTGPSMPMIMGGTPEAPITGGVTGGGVTPALTGPNGLPVVKVATDPHKPQEGDFERGFEQLREQQQNQTVNPNLIQDPNNSGNPVPANLGEGRGYDALRKGTSI